MTKAEYLLKVNSFAAEKNKAQKLHEVYTGDFPELLDKIITNSSESIFFDDGTRILSYAEVIDAEKDLHVDFNNRGLIPVADCGDNDFIVYDYTRQIWAEFNIVDETLFKKRAELKDLL